MCTAGGSGGGTVTGTTDDGNDSSAAAAATDILRSFYASLSLSLSLLQQTISKVARPQFSSNSTVVQCKSVFITRLTCAYWIGVHRVSISILWLVSVQCELVRCVHTIYLSFRQAFTLHTQSHKHQDGALCCIVASELHEQIGRVNRNLFW